MFSAAIVFKEQDTEPQISHNGSLIRATSQFPVLHKLVKVAIHIAGNLVCHAYADKFHLSQYDSTFCVCVPVVAG